MTFRVKDASGNTASAPSSVLVVAGTVAPSYIDPLQGLQRLEKIMDEYVGGYSMFYVTSEHLLNRGLELLQMLTEDFESIGAEDLHQLQRAWELQHRIVTGESVAAASFTNTSGCGKLRGETGTRVPTPSIGNHATPVLRLCAIRYATIFATII